MMIIFSFFSIMSVAMVTWFCIALLNVIIRRESAFLIEERIKVIVESRKKIIDPVLSRIDGCEYASNASLLTLFTEYMSASWPDSQTLVSTIPPGVSDLYPRWLDSPTFTGIVEDHGKLEIRFLRMVKRKGCIVKVVVRVPLGEAYLSQSAAASGLEVVDSRPVMLRQYRNDEGLLGEIEANFLPGSWRPIPVVVVARNWESASIDSWVICQLRPGYSRTIAALSRMGLGRASWFGPVVSIGFGLCLVYACGVLFSLRLSRRIVSMIDNLSYAAHRVGLGDFSVSVPVAERDQLGLLATSFNTMTNHLKDLREQEKQRIILERDIALAYEAQQYLYPRFAPVLEGANLCGMTAPARIVSGDLYDFFPFGDNTVGLLCADVSGKGMSAALMMAHLQAVAHGRMLDAEKLGVRTSPSALASVLNRDLCGRFGDNRYATMFYGEYNSSSRLLRYVNAGNCPPIVIAATGEVTVLRDGDLPIGLFPDMTYRERALTLSCGSAIVVYSDGLIDALNLQGEEFGEERLVSCCKLLPKGTSAESICSFLSQRVAEWEAGAEQFDDTTLVVLATNRPDTSFNGAQMTTHSSIQISPNKLD
jgi:serine phosphatase RsbU (regulator of sigma subunit)